MIERSEVDDAIVSGKRLASPPEVLARILAALLRAEDERGGKAAKVAAPVVTPKSVNAEPEPARKRLVRGS